MGNANLQAGDGLLGNHRRRQEEKMRRDLHGLAWSGGAGIARSWQRDAQSACTFENSGGRFPVADGHAVLRIARSGTPNAPRQNFPVRMREALGTCDYSVGCARDRA